MTMNKFFILICFLFVCCFTYSQSYNLPYNGLIYQIDYDDEAKKITVTNPAKGASYSEVSGLDTARLRVVLHNALKAFQSFKKPIEGVWLAVIKMDLEKQLAMKKDQTSILESQTSTIEAIATNVTKLETEVSGKVTQLETEITGKTAALQNENQNLNNQVNDLQNENQTLNNQVNDLQNTFKQLIDTGRVAFVVEIPEFIPLIYDTEFPSSEGSCILYETSSWNILKNIIQVNTSRYNKSYIPSENKEYKLKVKSVSVRTYNNMLHKVDIVGHVVCDNDSITPDFTVTNEKWGINPRFLVNGDQTIALPTITGIQLPQGLRFDYSDALDIRPSETGPISYMMKDGELANVKPGESIKFKRRNLIDYFYANLFFDFNSLAEEPNRDIFSEFHFDVPLGNLQCKGSTFFNYFNSEVTFAADIANVNRPTNHLDALKIYNTGKTDSLLAIAPFEAIRYNFTTMSSRLNVYQWEIKKINTWMLADLGARGFMTGVREKSGLDDTDFTKSSITNYVFSYAPELNLRFNFTPDNLFGGYMNFGCMAPYRTISTKYHDIYEPDKPDFDTIKNGGIWTRHVPKTIIFRTELGAYFYPFKNKSTTKGGLFAKFIYYKSAVEEEGFPQLLVGYSTDVSRFIKK